MSEQQQNSQPPTIPMLEASGLLRFPMLETTPIVDDLIARHAPICIGVSGGKDSDVAAFETRAYLKERGHYGPVILIHSDLGRVEHKDSLPACQALSDRLGLELVVVKRKKGDLMDRWQSRWHDNVERYSQLKCVKLILPWSTPVMRFCTSELKTAIICRELVARFPQQTILSVVGIRREESATRARTAVHCQQPLLTNSTHGTAGYNWHPILPWTTAQVFEYHRVHQIPLHEAYGRGMSRVSCAFCILAGIADLAASATNPENHDIYRELVDLEIASSFSFQSSRWLGDVAPQLLSTEQLTGLEEAKRKARERERVEQRVPAHLLYKSGWPTAMPTRSEAVLLSEVRRSVADIMHIEIFYREPDAILARYTELMSINAQRKKGIETRPSLTLRQESLWQEVGEA